MKDIRKIIFILMCFVFAVGCAGQERHAKDLLLSGTEDGQEEETGFDSVAEETDDTRSGDGKTTPQEPLIYVQVSGAVNAPGVYALPEGSRVFQALELAGGVSGEADVRSLNQAQPLTDGEMIRVLTAEEAAQAEEEQTLSEEQNPSGDDGKVNLNTATKEELMKLPGIGAAKAERILAWREDNGSFTQIEDLMKIEGIKEGVFSKVEEYVKVQ